MNLCCYNNNKNIVLFLVIDADIWRKKRWLSVRHKMLSLNDYRLIELSLDTGNIYIIINM